jgi:hypothetical protein
LLIHPEESAMNDSTSKPIESKPAKEKKYPAFVSTSDQPVALSLLSGHTASVGVDPTPLHPMFHREAVMRGCVPAGFQDDIAMAGVANNTQKTRDEVILDAISRMVDEAVHDVTKQTQLFTGDGRPDATVLSARCGFQVRAGERDAAWDKYQALDPSLDD